MHYITLSSHFRSVNIALHNIIVVRLEV